jgi:hypothetical protein
MRLPPDEGRPIHGVGSVEAAGDDNYADVAAGRGVADFFVTRLWDRIAAVFQRLHSPLLKHLGVGGTKTYHVLGRIITASVSTVNDPDDQVARAAAGVRHCRYVFGKFGSTTG